MDGTIAAVVLGVSLLDMGLNHCPTDCLGARAIEPRWGLSAGAVAFQEDIEGGEIALRRDFGVMLGPFQPTLGLSTASGGATWLGAGVLYTLEGPFDLYLQGHVMPGLYLPAGGRDLGGSLQFRSGIELGYEASSGLRLGLAFDHRSNADLFSYNPGLETLQLRVTWTTPRADPP
jgi:hypothetical protein